jgi:protein-tyrosine phosphatase
LKVRAAAPGASTVLFLCSGNYFRSRFAEELFNHWAPRLLLPWRADSRGLIEDLGALANVGDISPYAREALTLRGIHLGGRVRAPASVTESDLRAARLVVALKEAEHRPMVAQRFPDWEERIDYWAVHDIDVAHPGEGIAEAERRLLALLRELRGL